MHDASCSGLGVIPTVLIVLFVLGDVIWPRAGGPMFPPVRSHFQSAMLSGVLQSVICSEVSQSAFCHPMRDNHPPSGFAPLEGVPSVAPPLEVVLPDAALGECDLHFAALSLSFVLLLTLLI